MPHPDLQLTQACAELIRLWHVRYGTLRRPSNMDDSAFLRYQERVAHFRDADLSRHHEQQAIAREQQSGVFEWHYASSIPTTLWSEAARRFEISDHHPPENLGEAARWILDLLKLAETTDSRPDNSLRVAVQAETCAQLLEQAREFYSDLFVEQTPALGGVNVLLSCSLERFPSAPNGHNGSLLRPEVLGLRVVIDGERPDDLIDAIRRDELVVEDVIGGSTEPMSANSRHDKPSDKW